MRVLPPPRPVPQRGGVPGRAEAPDGVILDFPLLVVQLMLAFGGALLVGNLAVLLRHRFARDRESLPPRPPLRRLVVSMAIGFVVTVWALATLLVRF